MSNIELIDWEYNEIAMETKMKNITITFTGEMATGKSRFMRALADYLESNGVKVADNTANTLAGQPHQMVISSEDALKFANDRGF